MGKRSLSIWGLATIGLVTLFAFQNCAEPGQGIDLRAKMGTAGQSDDIFGQGDPVDDGNPTNIVCDPFATTEKTTPGLKAALYIYEGSDPERSIDNLGDMFSKGKKIEDTAVYFSQLYVPTRAWTNGFANQGGQTLKNSMGEVLIEWFGLRFETLLKLNDTDEEGYYQLGTISDDGSVVEIDKDGKGFKRIVDNDGETPTRLKCGGYVYLRKGDRIPARIAYFQGPRVEIALNMIWRKVEPGVTPSSLHCNSTGDFFSGGKDGKKMKDLKSKGWKVMETTNFELKEKVAVDCSKK